MPKGTHKAPVVLAVSPDRKDPDTLERSLKGWSVRRAGSCHEAMSILKESACNVVVCEKQLPDGGWHDLLNRMKELGAIPPLVVMAMAADESLWAEVLRSGGFDLLSKPLESSELNRIVPSAQTHGFERRVATHA